ncbi:MAG: SUMF1/EgtB/PvdO family nonheme iron enzyme, partial [Chloroflexota bacterium]
TGLNRTSAVGCFLAGASAEGVHDLNGNISEWCSNVYDERSIPHPVARGGSYLGGAQSLRNTFRDYYLADVADSNIGFRVVASRLPAAGTG